MDDMKQQDEESIFQEKYKVPSTELKLVKNTIDQLDIILTLLNNDEEKPYSIYKIKFYVTNQKLKIPHKDLQLAVDKLCDDKHVLLIENFDGRSPIQKINNVPICDKSYRITYLGRVFLNSVSKKYTNRPYKFAIGVQRSKQMWTNTKTVAAFANGLIIIIIAIIGIYVKDKSNMPEQIKDEKRVKSEKQEKQIDSLIKLTTDTTRFKIK